MGKIASDTIGLDQMGAILQPFLKTLSTSPSWILRERIKDKVFRPLLESNATRKADEETESSSEEENLAHVDGGKLS